MMTTSIYNFDPQKKEYMLTAIIIDDIAEARATLKADLAECCPDIEVIGEAEGVVTGAKILREQSPDMVFLDIQMGDGSGFDLLQILGDIQFHVIFTTAHDTFAIKAFRYSAVDYLLKPIDTDLLEEAVDKIRAYDKTQSEQVETLLHNVSPQQPLTRLALHTTEKIHVVPVSEIVRCESSGHYTIFYLENGRQLLVSKPMKFYDQMLKDNHFIRVHHSHLVNGTFIKEYVKIDGGYLVLKDGTDVPVSMRKRAAVIEMLNSL
ncbi:LytTR family DNA-binding domain-containing protein [Pontibacter sp. G13]|uniref:LytR/AlgR family response regulator transcription factor n=1 Tax=Pontibacter sp. G13 TaxID=3074898 RepID=UPI00288C0544|nr:LytTR family DNA-binding domain-containing protein [Pontibacter sp. G13]WNJ17963.1 LytTR family DNA-binding domain-containing protein [Pontibacter sp. G13]